MTQQMLIFLWIGLNYYYFFSPPFFFQVERLKSSLKEVEQARVKVLERAKRHVRICSLHSNSHCNLVVFFTARWTRLCSTSLSQVLFSMCVAKIQFGLTKPQPSGFQQNSGVPAPKSEDFMASQQSQKCSPCCCLFYLKTFLLLSSVTTTLKLEQILASFKKSYTNVMYMFLNALPITFYPTVYHTVQFKEGQRENEQSWAKLYHTVKKTFLLKTYLYLYHLRKVYLHTL